MEPSKVYNSGIRINILLSCLQKRADYFTNMKHLKTIQVERIQPANPEVISVIIPLEELWQSSQFLKGITGEESIIINQALFWCGYSWTAVFSSKWLLIASLLSSFVVCKTFGFYVRNFSMTCEYFLGLSARAYGAKERWKTIKCTGVHEKTRLGANNVASAPLNTWNFLNGSSIKG